VCRRFTVTWWGDVDATVAYCKRTVRRICQEYGGDPNAVVLAGFSRGAIACNYIGPRDDEIASLWCGFICHSHYDGVLDGWPYADKDRDLALARLKRLGNKPQFISDGSERHVAATRSYLKGVYPSGNFTFLTGGFREHTDTWVLRDIPARKTVREWFHRVTERNAPQEDGHFKVDPTMGEQGCQWSWHPIKAETTRRGYPRRPEEVEGCAKR